LTQSRRFVKRGISAAQIEIEKRIAELYDDETTASNPRPLSVFNSLKEGAFTLTGKTFRNYTYSWLLLYGSIVHLLRRSW
jgi:hypothetical protein